MSEAKHTPGRLQATPWGNSDCSGWDLTINAHLLPLSDASSATEDEAEANARRLVACWNACEGLPIYALEAGRMSPDAFQLNESRADQAERQRDELLEALQGLEREGWLRHIVTACKKESADSTLYGAVTAARSAIAKATQ